MYKFLCALVGGFMRVIFRINVQGLENIPADGGGILCANHISNWDPVLLQIVMKRRIYYMAKDELFHTFFVGFILKKIGAIPVKRSGSDLTAIKQAFKTISGGQILGIFPTGQREKKKGEGEVKAGVGRIAGKTKAPVIPVHISASYHIFSRITINIGNPCTYFLPEGQKKATATDFESISNLIYAEITALGEE